MGRMAAFTGEFTAEARRRGEVFVKVNMNVDIR